jgi:hypothetical protein
MAKITVLANQRTAPRWAGDFISDDRLIPGGAKVDPTQFFAEDSVKVNVGAAGAAGNATSVPVDALSGPIPSGTTLHFGSKKFATLTAPAAAGDTAITVEALPTALVQNDNATYPGTKEVSIPSGTLLGRTYAERDASTPYGPAGDSDDEFYLLAFDISDANIINDAELYRHAGIVLENYLPVFSSLSSTLKGKIRSLYECSVGVN